MEPIGAWWAPSDHNVKVFVVDVLLYDADDCLDDELVDVAHLYWRKVMGQNLYAGFIMFPRQRQDRGDPQHLEGCDGGADAVEE